MSRDPFEQAIALAGQITDHRREDIAKLIDRLDRSIRDWDIVYPQMVQDGIDRDMKLTEEKLRVTVRNEMRVRQMEIPEIIRWKLRAMLGGVESHD